MPIQLDSTTDLMTYSLTCSCAPSIKIQRVHGAGVAPLPFSTQQARVPTAVHARRRQRSNDPLISADTAALNFNWHEMTFNRTYNMAAEIAN